MYFFLTMIGRDAYKVAHTLCSPKVPDVDYNYNELLTLLKMHYTTVGLQIAESFKFRKCVQKDGESISDYVSRLRKCASTCDYSTFLDCALKEQFIVKKLNCSCFPRNILLWYLFSKLLPMELLLGSLLIMYLVPLLQIH